MDESENTFLPLDQRKLKIKGKNGVLEEVPALHKTWADLSRNWMPFQPPPLSSANDADKQEWEERTGYVMEDLDFLLGLEHHRFWSQLVHDGRVHRELERTLQLIPRPHDLSYGDIDKSAKKLAESVMEKLFLVFVRLCTHKESRSDFITPTEFGQLIYDYFLIDIPRIIDICVLFRKCSPKIVEKMVANVFKHQRAYSNDLALTVESITNSMSTVTDRVNVLIQYSTFHSDEQRSELQDLVAYVIDVMVSISELFQGYPPTCKIFFQQGFVTSLSNFYEIVIVALSKYVIKLNDSKGLSQRDHERLSAHLSASRLKGITAFRQIVSFCYIKQLLENPAAQEDKVNVANEFIDFCTQCLADGTFIVDYDKLYPVRDDIDLFTQAGIETDSTRLEYLLNGIQTLKEEFEQTLIEVEQKKFNEETMMSKKGEKSKATFESIEGATSRNPEASDKDVHSMIGQVRDLLPDLGEGFIKSCLEYYDNNPERVINAIFEENLPPHLMELDRKLELIVEPAQERSDHLARRNNIYNEDEFDITMRDSVDLSRVHKGKRKTPKDAKMLLDDKKELEGMKERFNALSIITDDVFEANPNYEDEYDDTYDDHISFNDAAAEAEPEAKQPDELTARRPFVLPRALGGGHVSNRRADDESESDGSDEDKQKDEFVRNPEDVRAEAERRRQTKMARQKRPGGGPAPNRDVVGGPKGQGQDKQVLINRARKNTNKGKRHRQMADKKQSKGMF